MPNLKLLPIITSIWILVACGGSGDSSSNNQSDNTNNEITDVISAPPAMPDYVTKVRQPSDTGNVVDFLGASNTGINAVEGVASLGAGRIRFQVSWADIEIEKGEYDWNALDELMMEAKSNNVGTVMMVRNTAHHALPSEGYSFTDGSFNYIISAESLDVSGKINTYSYTRNGEAQSNREGETILEGVSRLRPSNPQDLVDFINDMLARYTSDPDRYADIVAVQVGNEHIPTSGHYPLDGPAEVGARYFEPVWNMMTQKYPEVLCLPSWPSGASQAQIQAFENALSTARVEAFAIHYRDAESINDYLDTYGEVHMTEYGDTTRVGTVFYNDPQILHHALSNGYEASVYWWPANSNSGKGLLNNNNAGIERSALYTVLGNTVEPFHSFTHDSNDFVFGFNTDYGQAFALGAVNQTDPVNLIFDDTSDIIGARIINHKNQAGIEFTHADFINDQLTIDISNLDLAEMNSGSRAFLLQVFRQ